MDPFVLNDPVGFRVTVRIRWVKFTQKQCRIVSGYFPPLSVTACEFQALLAARDVCLYILNVPGDTFSRYRNPTPHPPALSVRCVSISNPTSTRRTAPSRTQRLQGIIKKSGGKALK